MLKPKRSGRLLLTLLLTILVLGCSSAQLPTPPKGNLYSIDVPDGVIFCSDIQSGNPCKTLKLSEADKFYAISPQVWMEIENYIDLLVNRLKGGGSVITGEMTPQSNGGTYVYVEPQDLERVKSQMLHVRKTLARQKRHYR